jgi:Na+/melibiose symporter-like transporter
MVKVRKTSSFEKMLLIVGLLVLVIGYMLISKTYDAEGNVLSWGFLQTTFLWLLMVIFIIMLAIGEDIKEGILIQQLDEIKKLKESMMKKKKKG